jgi:hypothetical protein
MGLLYGSGTAAESVRLPADWVEIGGFTRRCVADRLERHKTRGDTWPRSMNISMETLEERNVRRHGAAAVPWQFQVLWFLAAEANRSESISRKLSCRSRAAAGAALQRQAADCTRFPSRRQAVPSLREYTRGRYCVQQWLSANAMKALRPASSRSRSQRSPTVRQMPRSDTGTCLTAGNSKWPGTSATPSPAATSASALSSRSVS